jgi:hypothetical protein
MAKSSAKTITIAGKQIPLKNDGSPNLKYLSKEQRDATKTYVDKVKRQRKDVELKELTEILKKLLPA